jgi:putative FmdB family regulatory protein
MPIFEFTCRECGHGFEEILSLAELEAGDLKCPACESTRVERGFSTFATTSSQSAEMPPCATGGGCGAGGGFT